MLACQLLLLIGITSAKGIWMARIGSTFTADQQFESFTRMPAFLIGFCTAPVRPPHNIRNCVRRTGGIVRVEAMGAVGAQAAERAEPERDESIVTKKLPEHNGEFEYRVRSVNEPHERVVRESELSDVP